MFARLIIRPDKNAVQSDLENGRNGLRYIGFYIDRKHWANMIDVCPMPKTRFVQYLLYIHYPMDI